MFSVVPPLKKTMSINKYVNKLSPQIISDSSSFKKKNIELGMNIAIGVFMLGWLHPFNPPFGVFAPRSRTFLNAFPQTRWFSSDTGWHFRIRSSFSI